MKSLLLQNILYSQISLKLYQRIERAMPKTEALSKIRVKGRAQFS